MGIWSALEHWWSSRAEVAFVPDYAAFSDERLEALWPEREELTDAAFEAFGAECERRGVRFAVSDRQERALRSPIGAAFSGAQERKGEEEAASAEKPGVPRPSGRVLDTSARLGVLLQTFPGRHVLVVMPLWDPAPVSLPEGLVLDALVICNHEPRGSLHASALAAAAGLPPEQVYATAAGPIDRTPGVSGGEAHLLPSTLRFGNLTLKRMPGFLDVLRATWRGARVSATIGPSLPASLVGARPESNVYVGSLPAPAPGRLEWSAMLAAAFSAQIMGRGGPQVILLGDAVGAALRSHTHLLSGTGIGLVGLECPVRMEAIDLLGAILEDRWDQVSSQAADPTAVEDVLEHLVVEGRLEAAGRLVACAGERLAQDAMVHRLRATLLAVHGELEPALMALEHARVDPFTSVIASALLAASGDLAGAEAEARRATAALPGDPDAIAALSRALWLAGRVAEARAVLDEPQALSLTATRAASLFAVIEQPVPGDPYRHAPALALPHLAERALTRGRRAPDGGAAEHAFRRALALDPHCAEARELLDALISNI